MGFAFTVLAGKPSDRGNGRRSAKLLEDGARCVELEFEAVLVADQPARAAKQDARNGELVGCFELLPGPARLAQLDQGGVCVSGRKLERPASLRGEGPQQVRAVAGRDLVELVARFSRRVEIVGHEHDFDECGEQTRPGGGISRLGHGAADRGGRRIQAPLREAE